MALRRPPLARLIGRRIATLRAELGLTQEKLAWDAGLESKGYLSRIESGQRVPSLELLDRLARRLGVEPRDLLLFPDHDDLAAAMELVRRGGPEAAARIIRSTVRKTVTSSVSQGVVPATTTRRPSRK